MNAYLRSQESGEKKGEETGVEGESFLVAKTERSSIALLSGNDIAMCAGIFTNYKNCPIAKSLVLSVFYSPR
ncbi:hypothetical protein D5R40_27010 [Okeania hirsuta]|uniref:Uncharacterized protein n=1 Tax=Okeania hirsuta TaxID=1458930 RepID=A0A3N6P507_9CYAN|nr:hypothetical protein D4Z78_13620 [Okeania hirsuta]RQH27579.1 hypothetical protein D5R40_27010 [Okeania hirsuta]